MICRAALNYSVIAFISNPTGSCLLQKHRPGELENATARVAYTEGTDILHNMKDVLHTNGGPKLLIFGDSHVNHLRSFVKIPGHPKLMKIAFEHTEFVGVGGTTWSRVKQEVQGEELLGKKAELGNQ